MILLLGIPLVAFLAFCVAYGLAYGSQGLAKGIAGFFQGYGPILSWFGGVIAGPTVQLARWLAHELGALAVPLEKIVARWIGALDQVSNYVTEHSLAWGRELYNVVQWTQWKLGPWLVKQAVKLIQPEITALWHHVTAIPHITIPFPKITRKEVRDVLAGLLPFGLIAGAPALSWLRHHLGPLERLLTHPTAIPTAVGRAITHDLPVPWGRTVTSIRRRLHRLEHVLSRTGAVALVATALTALGLDFLRCRDFRRLGKRIGCGGFGLLADLLGGAFTAFVVTDICALAGAVTALAEWYRPLLIKLVDVENMLVGCHGATAPPDLTIPPLQTPPLVGALALV